jgi:hypothetical protein
LAGEKKRILLRWLAKNTISLTGEQRDLARMLDFVNDFR